MTGASLIEDLTRRGVKMWAEGGELRCRGSKKTLTPEVLDQLKEHKPEILARLRPAPKQTAAEVESDADIRCIHRLPSKECAVCSGYVRWLIADEERLRRAQNNPEAVRREFWRAESAEDRQAVDEMVTQKTPASFLAVPGENITVAELQARRDQGQNAVIADIAVMPSGKAEGESDPDDSAGGLGGHLRRIRDKKRAEKKAEKGGASSCRVAW
jgi:hypothetical protein